MLPKRQPSRAPLSSVWASANEDTDKVTSRSGRGDPQTSRGPPRAIRSGVVVDVGAGDVLGPHQHPGSVLHLGYPVDVGAVVVEAVEVECAHDRLHLVGVEPL